MEGEGRRLDLVWIQVYLRIDQGAGQPVGAVGWTASGELVGEELGQEVGDRHGVRTLCPNCARSTRTACLRLLRRAPSPTCPRRRSAMSTDGTGDTPDSLAPAPLPDSQRCATEARAQRPCGGIWDIAGARCWQESSPLPGRSHNERDPGTSAGRSCRSPRTGRPARIRIRTTPRRWNP